MSDNQEAVPAQPGAAEFESYEPPALERLGTVEQITRGPDPGAGDVPVGVISF